VATTPKGIPYPAITDSANVPSDMAALATSVDTLLDSYVGANNTVLTGITQINNPKFGYTTTATAGGTTTLTAASTNQQYFTGTLNQTIVLPVTSTLQLGLRYRIVNNSTGTLTITSSGGNSVTTVLSGAATTVTCVLTSGTTAASWDIDSTFVAASNITGAGTGVTTFLTTPSSANLLAAMTDETGSGLLTFATSPTLSGTPLAPTAAADTNTTQIATTAYVVGQAGSATPVVNGTATVGTSLRYSRQDHIHPTDTSRAATASPTFTGQVTVPAGSTSAAPIIFQSGSLLSAAAGGRMEYDGRLHYLTPSSSAVGGRAIAESSHIYTLTAARTLTNVNTAQSIFGVGLTMQGTTTYELEMMFSVSTTGTTSNSLGISFGGTATLTSIGYQAQVAQNATSAATITALNNQMIATAANTTVTSAVATATFRNVWVKGLVRVNASGTFIPQLTYSAAPGVAPVVATDSYVRLTPIGTNTVTTIGAWA
jgi:hypothetical protein